MVELQQRRRLGPGVATEVGAEKLEQKQKLELMLEAAALVLLPIAGISRIQYIEASVPVFAGSLLRLAGITFSCLCLVLCLSAQLSLPHLILSHSRFLSLSLSLSMKSELNIGKRRQSPRPRSNRL